MNTTQAKQISRTSTLIASLMLASCIAGEIQHGTVERPTVTAPTVDAFTARSTAAELTITGTKEADTAVWLQMDVDAVAHEVAVEDSSTTWSTTLYLRDGINLFVVFGSSGEFFSGLVGPLTADRDNTPPSVPVFDAPASPVNAPSVILTGSRDPEGNLCLRAGQLPTCTEVAAIDGESTFILAAQALSLGSNTFCLSSTDDLGNVSAEACVTIVRVAGPEVTITSPVDGARLAGDSIGVMVDVTVGASADEAITSVSVCLDGANCVSATLVGDAYEAELTLTGLTDDSSHTIEATATNLATMSGNDSISITYDAGGIELVSDNLTAGHSQEVDLALDANGVLHVVWADECSQLPGCDVVTGTDVLPWDVFYRSMEDGVWSVITLISDNTNDADSRNPSVAVDGNGHIHIAWADAGTIAAGDTDSAKDIVVRIVDGSTGALGTTVVVDHTGDEDTVPQLAAADDGTVHVVWDRLLFLDNTDHDVTYAKWTPDGGDPTTGVWSSPLVVSEEDAGTIPVVRPAAPAIATDSASGAWVVWQEYGEAVSAGADYDILLRRVAPAGTAETALLVTDNGLDGESLLPAVAVDGDDVVQIIWKDTGDISGSGADFDVWHRSYDAVGTTFSTYLLITTESTVGSDTPALALDDDGGIIAAWAESVGGGNAEVFFRVHRAGLNGSRHTASTGTDDLSLSPSMVVTATGDLHIAWQDDSTIDAADELRPALYGGDEDTDILWQQLHANTDWAQVP